MRFLALIGCAAVCTTVTATNCAPQCAQCVGNKCVACNPTYTLDKDSNRCKASCIGSPTVSKPAKPATPFELNGQVWPEMCLNSSTAHFFSIGDWGGLGEVGQTWTNPWKCSKKVDDAINPVSIAYISAMGNVSAPEGLRPCTDADDWAQRYVARQMKVVAQTAKPDYVLNVGDNFYPGGIDTPCEKAGKSGRWRQQFDKVYGDPILDKAPWFSVLGNHDYGGIKFLAGWDHQIFETWNRDNWIMPGQFWRRKVQYSDFAVEYFFLDSNVKDARVDPNHCICQGEGSCYNMTKENCATTLDKVWSGGLKMLEEGLKASTAEWHIIVTHFPGQLFTGDKFFQQMHEMYGIDLFVTGHTHFQATGRSNGIGWVLTGGGGGVTSDIPPNMPGGNDDAYGFVDFTINRTHLKYDMHSWGGVAENGDVVIRKSVTVNAREKKQVSDNSVRAVSKPEMCLSVADGQLNDGGNVALRTCSGADEQQFEVRSDNTIRVKSKPELCLNVANGAEFGNNVVVFTCSAAANEQWELRASDNTIRSKYKAELCLNAAGGDLAENDNVALWACSAAPNEQFLLPTQAPLQKIVV